MKRPEWWLRFKAKIKDSKLYTVCWSRPIANAPVRTKFSYVVACLLLALAYAGSGTFFSPYLPLDELNKIEVTVLKSYSSYSKHSGGKSWLEFRTREGEVKKYEIAGARKNDIDAIDNYRGKKAIVWYGYEYRHFGSDYLIWQIKIKGNLVINYRYDSDSEIKKANKKMFKFALFCFLFGSGMFVFLMSYVVFRLGKLNN